MSKKNEVNQEEMRFKYLVEPLLFEIAEKTIWSSHRGLSTEKTMLVGWLKFRLSKSKDEAEREFLQGLLIEFKG